MSARRLLHLKYYFNYRNEGYGEMRTELVRSRWNFEEEVEADKKEN